jgi:hypothetical protein
MSPTSHRVKGGSYAYPQSPSQWRNDEANEGLIEAGQEFPKGGSNLFAYCRIPLAETVMNAGSTDKLAAVNSLVAQARKLVASQEQEVARMRAVGLNVTRAQSLLDAYGLSLRLAEQELADAERSIEPAENVAQPVRGKR